VTLQVLVVAALLRRGWLRFKGLFVYCVVLLLTTAVEASAFYSPQGYFRTSGYYWTLDAVRQVLIFFLVIALIQAGLAGGNGRRMRGSLLAAGVVALSLVSLYASRQASFSLWMTEFARDLGFIAVILNLALWAVLLQARQRNLTLLMISGGMGIQMAGKAIGHSLRQMSQVTVLPGDLVIVLSHLFCLYVWWQALRLPPPEGDSQLS
jgi:hypothetical protein